MISRILFPARPDLSVSEFLKSVQEGLSGVSQPQKANGRITFQVEGTAVEMAASGKPAKWDLDRTMQYSEGWPVDRKAMATHGAQLIFRVSGEDAPQQQAINLIILTLMALDQAPQALGVYWETADQVLPTDVFRMLAVDPDSASQIWISTHIKREGFGGATGCSRGMAAFGLRKLETRNANESPEELLGRFRGLIDYLLANGPIVKDGDTFGQTANEKITAQYADKSSFGNPGLVMNLDYADTDVINPNAAAATQSGFRPPSKVGATFGGRRNIDWRVPVFITGGVIGLALIGILVIWAMSATGSSRVNQSIAQDKDVVGGGYPARERLQAAERLVATRGEEKSFGNTPEARQLARALAGAMMTKWTGWAEQGKVPPRHLPDGDFVTYCELHERSVAFIFYVPELEDLPRPMQFDIGELAWKTILGIARTRERQLVAVGLKEANGYGSVQLGITEGEIMEGDALYAGSPGVPWKRSTDGAMLEMFFDPGLKMQHIAEGRRDPVDAALSENDDNTADPAADPGRQAQVATGQRPANRRHPNRQTGTGQPANAIAGNGIQFKWQEATGHEYKGRLVSEDGSVKLESDLDLTWSVGSGGVISANGMNRIMITDTQTRSIRGDGIMMFDSSFVTNNVGAVSSFQGMGHTPLTGFPIALLPLIELPVDNAGQWETQTDATVRTVEVATNPASPPLVETRVVYPAIEQSGSGLNEMYGGGATPPGGLPPELAGIAPPERTLSRSEATETRQYRIANRAGKRLTIACDYLLVSREQPQPHHEVKYSGEYIFDTDLGLVLELTLRGNVRHRGSRLNLEVPFELTMKRQTAANLDRAAAARAQRKREREARDAAEAEMWQPDRVVQRLQSDDKDEIRDVLSGLSSSKVEPPNRDIGLALINLLADNPQDAYISSSVLEKWINKDLETELLDVLPNIENTSRARDAIDMLQEFETPGLAEQLIVCIDNENLRSHARRALNKLDGDIEELFLDLIEQHEDDEVLRIGVEWLGSYGTRKAISKLRRLARRTDNGILQRSCDSAIRNIESRR